MRQRLRDKIPYPGLCLQQRRSFYGTGALDNRLLKTVTLACINFE
jgi:hypothetical protein